MIGAYNVFRANLMRELSDLRRYPFNTLSQLITLLLLFAVIFFGTKSLIDGNPAFGETLEGIVVGFLLWSMSVGAYSTTTWQIMNNATRGTLEQLCLSPFGLGVVLGSICLSEFLVSLALSSVLLLAMMIMSGKWLHIDLVSILPLTIFTLLSVYGVGFALGGLALVFKRVQSLFQILQFVFIAFISLPDKFDYLAPYLPLSFGTDLLFRVMVKAESITTIPPSELLTLAANSVIYLGVGVTAFAYLERLARQRGCLGHY